MRVQRRLARCFGVWIGTEPLRFVYKHTWGPQLPLFGQDEREKTIKSVPPEW